MNQERREKAIAWLKEEIRSLELAPELNGCPMTPEWEAQLDIMRTCLEAVQDHFPDTTKMIPLALDKIKEFDKHVVFVDIVRKSFGICFDLKSQFGIVKASENRIRLFNGRSVFFSSYGDWIAYSYQTVHIDRESWKCHVCSAAIDTFAQKKFGFRYCKNCGRPLTPEAWAELEKRLRGSNP